MSNIYEVFNTNSDAEFSKFLDKLNLSSNDLLNVIEIAESYDDIQAKRHHLLEFMAGTAQGNYELCVNQFKPKFKRTLKESNLNQSLNLNQIMELNSLIELVASKLKAPNCMQGVFNIIKTKINSNAANTFLGMVQQSSVNDSNLKFNTDIQINGQNLAQLIYPIKNDIEIFVNSVQTPKKEENTQAKETTNESVNNQKSLNESFSKYEEIIKSLDDTIESTSNLNILKTIFDKINNLMTNVQNTNDANNIAQLKSKVESKIAELKNASPRIDESIAQSIVSDACSEDTFSQLLNNLRPTMISITVNKDNGDFENCVEDLPQSSCESIAQSIDHTNADSAYNALNSLSSHLNCVKSPCKENNLEELETINTLLAQLSDYFNHTLNETINSEALFKVDKAISYLENMARELREKVNSPKYLGDYRTDSIQLSYAANKLRKLYAKREKLLRENCSAGATCSANIASIGTSLKPTKKRKRKETIDFKMFKEYVNQDVPSSLEINGKNVSYKIIEGKNYLYIDNGILGSTNKQTIMEAIDDLYNNCLEMPVYEGFNHLELDLLLEDMIQLTDTNSTNSADEKQKENDLDKQINSNPNIKVNVRNPQNQNQSFSDQEIVGIDDSDINNKMYVTKDPTTGKIKVVKSTDISLQGDMQ